MPVRDAANSEQSPSRRGQGIALSLLFVAGVVNFFDRTALSIANTSVRAEMHLSATEIGWLLSAFSLAYGLAQLPLVEILQRVSPRTVLGAGLAVWSAAQMLTGFIRTLPSFLTMRVLLGAGESPFYPCGVQVVRDWFPQRSRGRATAVMSMSQTLGLAAAPPALTWLLIRSGWRTMFLVLGAAGLLAAAAWILFYREPPHVAAGFLDTHPGSQNGLWRTLLGRRMVWGMMLGFGGINYTNWLYTAWLPGYLETAHHVSLRRTGWMAAVPFLGGAAGMFTSGALADLLARRGLSPALIHRRNLVGGMVCSAAGTWVVAESTSVTRAVAGVTA
ncbi:MAG TPA: MFS transporter, partial [Acidobacteriaceae bacterium]|nr:MFS transporter [Acidobacteriaceae bacterium]